MRNPGWRATPLPHGLLFVRKINGASRGQIRDPKRFSMRKHTMRLGTLKPEANVEVHTSCPLVANVANRPGPLPALGVPMRCSAKLPVLVVDADNPSGGRREPFADPEIDHLELEGLRPEGCGGSSGAWWTWWSPAVRETYWQEGEDAG